MKKREWKGRINRMDGEGLIRISKNAKYGKTKEKIEHQYHHWRG